MAKSKRSRDRIHQLKLSDKELAVMREEHTDPNGAQRNAPMLQQMLIRDPVLSMILFDPALLPLLMTRVMHSLQSRNAFTGESAQNNEFMQALSQALLPHFNAAAILNDFVRIFKDRKVKREKRTLLWAMGDLMAVVYRQAPPERSSVFHTIVSTSIDNSTRLSEISKQIYDGAEPYHFTYEDYMEGSVPQDVFDRLNDELGIQLNSLQRVVSIWATESFEKIKKPFGLPFYDILHYPGTQPKKKSSIITSSNEEPDEETTEAQENEQFEKFFNALHSDRMMMTAQEAAKKAVQSMKAAGFGEIDREELTGLLIMAAFSLLFPFIDNPFLIRLYEYSGEHAGEYIAEDEKQDWIEITSSPENPQVYRNYGDTLMNKDEWQGARKAYIRSAAFMENPDTELMETIESLSQRLSEQDQYTLQSANVIIPASS